MGNIKDKCAIVGVGETEFSKDSGRSETMLACEAITKAVEDAGLSLKDIDVLLEIIHTDELCLTFNNCFIWLTSPTSLFFAAV